MVTLVASLPAADQISTVEALRGRIRLEAEAARESKRQPAAEQAASLFQQTWSDAGDFIRDFPNTPFLIDVVYQYKEAAKEVGARAYDDSVLYLYEACQTSEHPFLRYAIRGTLPDDFQFELNDTPRAWLMAFDLVRDPYLQVVEEASANANYPAWLRAELVYHRAIALHNHGRHEAALEVFQQAANDFGDAGELTDRAGYAVAFMQDYLHMFEPQTGIAAYNAYLAARPMSEYIDRALYDMFRIYVRGEDYEHAIEVGERLLADYPDSIFAYSTREGIDFVNANMRYIDPTSIAVEPTVLEAPQFAKACGPNAIQNWLTLAGHHVPASDVLNSIAMSAEGASLLSLKDAAAKLGIEAQAVDHPDYGSIKEPFLAHLEEGHYVLVQSVGNDAITYSDNGGRVKQMPRKAFEERWSGLALLREAPSGEQVADERLMLAMGGQTFPTPNEPDCPNGNGAPPDDCPDPYVPPGGGSGAGGGNDDDDDEACKKEGGDATTQGSVGPAGATAGGGGSADDSEAGASFDGSGVFGAGVTSGEIGFYIKGYQAAQSATQTDLYLDVKGELPLEFSRLYHNRWGKTRQALRYAGATWSSHIGLGWRHSIDTYLVTSTSVITGTSQPNGIMVARDGSSESYDWNATNSRYQLAGGHLNEEHGSYITFDSGTGKYTLVAPSGAKMKFAASSGAPYYTCRLESEEDNSGNALTYNYNGSGYLTKVDAPSGDGRFIELSRDANHFITKAALKTVSATLKEVTYAYATQGGEKVLSTITYQDGGVNTFTYGISSPNTTPGYIASFEDKAGQTWTFEYTYSYAGITTEGWNAHKIIVNDPDGSSTEFDRDNSTLNVMVRSFDGASGTGTLLRKKLWAHGTFGYLTDYEQDYVDSSPTSAVRRWEYSYNSTDNALLQNIQDPGGANVYSYSYNSQKRLSKLFRGSLISTADIEFDYDAAGLRITKRIDPDGLEHDYFYDASYRLTKYTHPSMGASDEEYFYNSAGELTKYRDARNEEWLYAYNAKGQMTSATDPLSNVTTYAYDDLNRLTQVTDATSRNTYYEYASGSCSCGAKTGRMTKIKDHDLNATSFDYNDNGDVTKVTNALAIETDYEYDLMHRMTRVTYPSGSGRSVVYAYDKLNRVTSVTGPTGKTVSYEYNFQGQLTRTVDPVGDIEMEYWTNGNLKVLTDGNGHDTTFYYHALGGVGKVVDAANKVKRYEYDGMGRLTKEWAATAAAPDTEFHPVEYQYSATTGMLTKTQYTNDITRSALYYYDDAFNLTRMDDWNFHSTSTGQYFEYDDAGRMTRYRDYDDDPSGTRQKVDYTYDGAGRLLTRAAYGNHDTLYFYDNIGRVTKVTSPGSKDWLYAYNTIGQVTEATMPNGMKTVYGYDSSDRRMTKIEHNDGATPTPTVLEGWHYELNPDGNISEMLSLTSSESWFYYYDGRDRLESAIHTNADGTPLYREGYTYDAGDNMLTKRAYAYDASASFMDDFDDGDYTNDLAWTVGAGTWAVDPTTFFLKNTGTTTDQIYYGNSTEDLEMLAFYSLADITSTSTNYLEFMLRYSTSHSPTDHVSVRIYEDKIQLRERYNNVTTTLDFADFDSPEGGFYAIMARCIGDRLEVLRADDNGWHVVGQMTGIQTQNTSRVYINTFGNMEAWVNDITYLRHKTAADSFKDTFADNNYHLAPTWTTSGGTWGAASGYLAQILTSGNAGATMANASPDNQMKVSVQKTAGGGSLRLYPREVDSAHKVYVEITDSTLNLKEQRDASTTVTLDTASMATTTNTWYDYHIVADGASIQVWRGPQGGTTELVLESAALEILTSDSIWLETRSCSGAFDNVDFIAPDPKTTTYAYNDANEMTTSTENSVTTTYTYDNWGRTVTKTDGTHTATYLWRFGSMLKSYDSTYPGEGNTTYNYDGLGRRRVKLENYTGSYTQADATWWRYGAGWDAVGEYASTDVDNWVIGGLAKSYVGKNAYIAGATSSSGAYTYLTSDHLGSIRGQWNASKARTGQAAFQPYGDVAFNVGGAMDWGFTGHKFDPESSMHHAPYRYLMSGHGRWLSRDPLGMVDGPNMYGYVGGRPILFTDPYGLFCQSDILPIAGITLVIVGGIAGGFGFAAMGATYGMYAGLSAGTWFGIAAGAELTAGAIGVYWFRDDVLDYANPARDNIWTPHGDQLDSLSEPGDDPNNDIPIGIPIPPSNGDDPDCWFS